MRGDAWRRPGRIDVTGPLFHHLLFDNLRMRGAKADHAPSHQTSEIAKAARTLFGLDEDSNALMIYSIF